MEAAGIFDDGDAGAPDKFDEPEGFEERDEPVGLFPLAGRLEDGIVFPDDNGAGAVFAEESFDFYLLGDLVGRHLIEGHFLPDDLFVGVVVGLQNIDLLLQLAAEFADDLFGFVDHDGEAVDAFHFGGGSVETFDIDLPSGEQDGDAVDQADLVLGIDGDSIFLLVTCHDDVFYFNLISLTLQPWGTMGKTLFSLPVKTSSK